MKPRLSQAAIQLREMCDDSFPDRDRRSDGWIADSRHMSTGHSDHIPDVDSWVRAIDIDRDLNPSGKPDVMPYLADQIRIVAKKDKRIAYVIFNGRIASAKSLWRFRRYTGINPHTKHCHISFTKKGDEDRSFFNIPLLGGTK